MTPAAEELIDTMVLANPCDPDTPEFDVWLRAALRGMRGKDAPTDDSTPAYAEGWEWGREWKEASHDPRQY